MRPVPHARAVTGLGFEGDRHFERLAQRRQAATAASAAQQDMLLPDVPGEALWARKNKRQVLLLDARSLAELEVQPGQLKENVVVEGLPLESFPPGQRLRVGEEAVLEVTEPCIPCWKLDALRPGLLSASYGKRGQLARVIREGLIHLNDDVVVLEVAEGAPRRPVVPKLP